MTFEESEEQRALREAAANLANSRYESIALEWDQEATPFPYEERKYLGDMGYLGITLPEEYGGSGGTLLDALIVIEELGKRSLTAAFQPFEANTGAARVIELFGTEQQKERYLPPIISGDEVMGVSISEPDAGSAATDLNTTAEVDGDRVVINGMKRWCSGAGHSEQYLVYVRMNDELGSRGIGAVVIPRDVEGLTFGEQEELMGFRGIPSADMFFDSVTLPAENVIVYPGGFRDLFTAFSIERLGNATMSLALAQAALDRTQRHVQEREQFGKELIEFQAVQIAVANMLISIEAARLLIRRAASKAGRGAPRPLEASVAKCFSNEMARSVTQQAIELHGGYGYHKDYHVERYHRDALGWALGGGTPTIQRIRIASEYLGRRFSQRD